MEVASDARRDCSGLVCVGIVSAIAFGCILGRREADIMRVWDEVSEWASGVEAMSLWASLRI